MSLSDKQIDELNSRSQRNDGLSDTSVRLLVADLRRARELLSYADSALRGLGLTCPQNSEFLGEVKP